MIDEAKIRQIYDDLFDLSGSKARIAEGAKWGDILEGIGRRRTEGGS